MLQAIQDCLSPFCSAGSVLCCLNHRHCKALMKICKPGSRLGLQLAALIKVLFDLKFHNTPVAETLLIFSLEVLFETEFILCNESQKYRGSENRKQQSYMFYSQLGCATEVYVMSGRGMGDSDPADSLGKSADPWLVSIPEGLDCSFKVCESPRASMAEQD